ncbi:hypothetical protein [Streptomyces sp. AcH 505]|uniref:hypothetical protein n=1 Tax=Streptomyces sp. AcH 505 TaxID=352211 RepID=UPI001F522B24
MYRRILSGLCGAALLTAGVLVAQPGGAAPTDITATDITATARTASVAAAAGATTPFVTVEAESGTLGGGARVRSISPGAPKPTAASLETEASGYALTELKANAIR